MRPGHVLGMVVILLLYSVGCGSGGDETDSGPVLPRHEGSGSPEVSGEIAVTDSVPAEDQAQNEEIVEIDACLADCGGKICGDDGCGGSCGDCDEGYFCDDNGMCKHDVCIPDCDGKACGDDGCGNDCGTCDECGSACADGQCVQVCLPDCTGKECGDDGCGCGNTCGDCPAGHLCEAGQCACTPDCEGKECGNDGCAGTCGECPPPSVCGPEAKCVNMMCPVVSQAACNSSLQGNNTGHPSNFPYYGCGFDASGPESIYTVAADEKMFVSALLKDMTVANDLYVLGPDCNPEICVDNDTKNATFTAEAAQTYHIVVDGYQGTYGPFTLDVTCIPIGDCPNDKIPGCDGQCQWGHWLGNGNCNKTFNCEEMNFDNGDCD